MNEVTVISCRRLQPVLASGCKSWLRSHVKCRMSCSSLAGTGSDDQFRCPHFKSLENKNKRKNTVCHVRSITTEETPGHAVTRPFSDMPGPSGLRNLPILGMRFHFAPYSKHTVKEYSELRREYLREYGKIYREVVGLNWAVHIHDPADVATMFRVEGQYPQRGFPSIFGVYDRRENGQVGLGSLVGEEWGKMRKAVQQKLLRPQSMRYYMRRMDLVAEDFIHRIWDIRDSDGNVYNIQTELQKYAVEEIGIVLFNQRFGCLEGELESGSEADLLIRANDTLFKEFALSTRVFPWFMFFKSPLYRRFSEAGNIIYSIGWKYMLEAMEAAMKTEETGSGPENNLDFIASLLQEKGISVDYVTTVAMDMFRGAVESTSNSLTFFLHTIARNPEKQEKLSEEIQRILPGGSPLTPETFDQMHYLKACWKESFRLIFPLPAGAPRVLCEDAVMSGYLVPKGTPVFPENAIMCRMEEYFERADEYIPERWMRGKNSGLYQSPLSQYIVLPFGHGVRNCLGRRFAEQNVQLAAVKILQNFRLECDKENIKVVSQIFQTTDAPLTVRFVSRPQSQTSS